MFFNRQRIKFHIDNLLGAGSNSLLAWLGLVSITFVSILSVLTWLVGLSDHEHFGDLLWDLMMRAITPWEIEASMGRLPYLLVLLLVTLFGIFVLSILISLLSTIIDARIRSVSKGIQNFPYDNHVVILGWTSRSIPIIEELITANQSERESCIVIGSTINHEELESRIKNVFGKLKVGTTTLYIRSRILHSHNTFKNLNVLNARRVLVLGDSSGTAQLDRLKITINLYNYFRENKINPTGMLVVEAQDNEEAKTLISSTKGTATPVIVSTLPARLIVETTFQPMLPRIYEELLSFDGNELYVTSRLLGLT